MFGAAESGKVVLGDELGRRRGGKGMLTNNKIRMSRKDGTKVRLMVAIGAILLVGSSCGCLGGDSDDSLASDTNSKDRAATSAADDLPPGETTLPPLLKLTEMADGPVFDSDNTSPDATAAIDLLIAN